MKYLRTVTPELELQMLLPLEIPRPKKRKVSGGIRIFTCRHVICAWTQIPF
ncbi:hypothetical protein ABVN80_19565 [Acinetobacter baumannii]